MSHGTISAVGTTSVLAPRMAAAVGELRDLKNSTVFSALNSLTKPTAMLRITTAEMDPPSIYERRPKLMAMAIIRTCTSELGFC